MSKLQKFFPILAFLLLTVGCEKSNTLEDISTSEKDLLGYSGQQPGFTTTTASSQQLATYSTYSQQPGIEPLREMMINHLKYHGTVEPWDYLPAPLVDTFKVKYMEEQDLMNTIGYDAYIDQKVTDGVFSADFSTAMKSLNNTINGIDDTNIGTIGQTLEAQRDALVLTHANEDELANLVYDLILSVVNELYPVDAVGLRTDDCRLQDLIGDIMQGVTIGGAVGEVISAIFANDGNEETVGEVVINVAGQAVGVSLTIVGSVIGGIIGGVVGIFNGNDCDCGQPQGISVVMPAGVNCGPTYQLAAWGAGDDAEFFDWIVTEGNSSATFPAQPALLGTPVTQASPNTPLVVSVTALCADAIGDDNAMAANTYNTQAPHINFYDIPANQVGDVLVTSNYNLSSMSNVSLGNTDLFSLWSTAGMANNTFSVSVFPPHMAQVSPWSNTDDCFEITWLNVGSCTITFTGTNACSGLQNSFSAPFTIWQ